jgi:oxalate decarboxylase/phosphoglucose isomerase-like protein (cupin superfamily)
VLEEDSMAQTPRAAFDLFGTYVHLGDGGGALPVTVTETFWDELMSGEYRSEDVRAFGEKGGWMLATFHMTESMSHWELHPEGDEILHLLSGAIDVVLQETDGERVVALRPGTTCVVPKGAWHRQIVLTPGDLLSITYGRGTQHRPA